MPSAAASSKEHAEYIVRASAGSKAARTSKRRSSRKFSGPRFYVKNLATCNSVRSRRSVYEKNGNEVVGGAVLMAAMGKTRWR